MVKSKKRKLTSVEEEEKLVGSIIEVWCPADEKFYKAFIESCCNHDRGLYKAEYVDDGVVKILNLNEQRWQFVNDPEEETTSSSVNSSSEMPPLQQNLDLSSSKAAQTSSPSKDDDNDDDDDNDEDSSQVTGAIETESSQAPPEEVVRYVNVTKTLNLRVDSFDNIDDVKNKFSAFEGIETMVFFTEDGFKNIHEIVCDGDDGSNGHMNLHLGIKLQVNIKVSWSTTSDRLISLDVHSWDTIGDVKTKFQDKEGTPANQLTLFYNEKQLDGSQTLAGYDIENHSTLDAFSLGEDKIVISVRTSREEDSDSIQVMVKLCSTVLTLKGMIRCMGLFAVDRQKLTFNGVILENGQRLADYKIQMGSVLDLDFIRRTNGVKMLLESRLTGRRSPIYVDSSDIVDTLKTEIRYSEGIPEKQQMLFFGRKKLENGRTLGDYNIENECLIFVP